MTPQETEKIKLMQLFKQGKIDTLPDVDMAYMTKKMMDTEKDMKEATSSTLERIDGLISRRLLIRFLDIFTEIYDDLVVGGDPFDVNDVIYYLTDQMQGRAEDSNMDADGFRSFEEEKDNDGYNTDPNLQMHIDDEEWEQEMGRGVKEEIDEAMMPRPSLFKGTDVEKQEYYASLKRDYDRDKEEFKRNYMNFSDEDWVEDFENYVADKGIDEGVTWMKRFSGLK